MRSFIDANRLTNPSTRPIASSDMTLAGGTMAEDLTGILRQALSLDVSASKEAAIGEAR
jgi:hypothetical protein